MNNIKIATFNVRGLREYKKRASIFQYLHQKEIDITLVQETHSTVQVEKSWKTQWGVILYSHMELICLKV